MKRLFINNNILKIIALIFMTISHIGVFLETSNYDVSFVLRAIGSISFPLILFLIIEGCEHTKNFNKYILRLSIFSLIIFLGILISSFLQNTYPIYQFGNIFIDLLMYVLIYFLIFKFKKESKYIFLLLIATFYLLTFLVKIDSITLDITAYKIIGGLFPQYSIFGLLIFITTIGVFYSYTKKCDEKDPNFKLTDEYKFSKNIFYCIILAIFSTLAYIFTYIGEYLGVNNSIETYMILAAIFIPFYSYKRGKINSIIKYSFYLYYPLHLLILYLVFLFI